jgi:hypothetical protein
LLLLLPEELLPEERLPEELLPEERLPEELLPEELLPEELLPEELLLEELLLLGPRSTLELLLDEYDERLKYITKMVINMNNVIKFKEFVFNHSFRPSGFMSSDWVAMNIKKL